MSPDGDSPVWQGVVAWPIVLSEFGTAKTVGSVPLDQLIVGAVAVHTTCAVEKDSSPSKRSGRSVFCEMDDEEMALFSDSLYECIAGLLSG